MSMCCKLSGRSVLLFVCCAPFCVLSPPVGAQARKQTPRRPPVSEARNDTRPDADTQTLELQDTVAILPWGYKNGKSVAMDSARAVCNQLLLDTGFNVFLVKSPTGAMPPLMP